MKDPYQTLGVSKTATLDEIKNAYRSLAKKLHPDLNPGNKEAETKFKEITQAYEMIGSPEARAKYDRGEFEEAQAGTGFGQRTRGPYYRSTQEPGGPQAEGGRYTFSFGEGVDESVFESIFGNMGRMGGMGGGAGAAKLRGEDQLYRMNIDLKDAAIGSEKELALPSGKRLAVKIPAGVEDGTRLRFSGLGSPGLNGGPPGDAYVELQIREDPRFKRSGEDLLHELPISINEAVFGGEVRTPTVDGEVLVKVPPKSNTGRKLKLSGKGLFSRQTGRRGDQIVILQVTLPDNIDPELESALKAWQSRHSYNPREKEAA